MAEILKRKNEFSEKFGFYAQKTEKVIFFTVKSISTTM